MSNSGNPTGRSEPYNPFEPNESALPPGARAPISHPYPPAYKARGSEPPSQSYGYDQRRRPSTSEPLQPLPSSFSDSPNPYDSRATKNSRTQQQQQQPYQSEMSRLEDEHDRERDDTKEVRVDVESVPAARGPKIGKGQYAENWTKEDEEAEQAFIKAGMFNWKKLLNWRFWIRSKWWYWYVIIIILCVLVGLMTIYNNQIVTWLTPVANYLKNLPAGWTIPIAVLFVLSFPPLFGQEIVAVLVGAVWGLWVGFGIVAAGTFLGEVGNFYAFRYCLRSHAIKLEEKNANYACLAHIVREGGFLLIVVIRLSAIPGHFSTAVFSTCGMGIFVFSAATILTLPKQLIIVYLGVIFADRSEKSNKEKIITWTTLIIGLVLTAWSAWYIYRKMYRARIVLWRRERLANKAAAAEGLGGSGGAQLNRRISYIAMLEQPQDDIEALSPMLPKQSRGGNLGPVYETPYELQSKQVHSPPVDPSPSSPAPLKGKEGDAEGQAKIPQTRRESAILPDSLAYPSPGIRNSSKTSKKEVTDPSSDAQHRRTESYETDRDRPTYAAEYGYGYNPDTSPQTFPTPHPHRISEDVDLGVRAQGGITRGFQLSDPGARVGAERA